MFKKIKEGEYKEAVLEAKEAVLLEFSYSYCQACQEVKEFIENNLEDKQLKLLELDISKSQAIAEKYNVDKTPTLLLFKNGKLLKEHIGYINQKELKDLLNELSFISKVKRLFS